MEVLYRVCCGLDVHKETVVACLIRTPAAGERVKEVRTFGTTRGAVRRLAAWLTAAGCTHLAMESTGVYGKPVYNLLEDPFTVWVVNAAHIKAVPGRKTDVKDGEWLADLLQHGLLRPSFIPDRAQRELRELTRTRTTLTDERSAAVCRGQAVLEDAGLKLAGVATDSMGVSGRAIRAALVAGTTDPAVLADLAKGKLRKKRAALVEALDGGLREPHRQLLALQLAHIDFLDEQITELSTPIAVRRREPAPALERLATIPGVGPTTAEVLAAEIGLDLSRFPSAAALASWAGMCPGNYESAGKRQGGKTRQGSKWLRRALTEAARAAARRKDCYLAAQYRRLVVRCGKPKAAVAVGHTMLVTAYYLLLRGDTYRDAVPAQRDQRRRERTRQRAVAQLQALGFAVALTPKDPAA